MRCIVFTRRLSLLSIAAAAGLFAAGVGNSASANLLWYDGFTTTDTGGDYDTTMPIGYRFVPADPGDDTVDPPIPPTPEINQPGQSGGTAVNNNEYGNPFFSGTWVQHGGDDSFVNGTSLSKPGQINPSTGGSNGETTPFGTARSSRVFTDQWGGFTDPEQTYYISYLVNYGALVTPDPAANQSQHRVVEMFNGASDGDSTRVLMFGYSHYALGPDFNDDMGLYVNGSTTYLDTDPSTPEIDRKSFDFDQDVTHCVVLKFELHQSDFDPETTADQDTISVFLDPMGDIEPALPNAQITVDEFFADRIDPNAYFIFDYDPVFNEKLPVVDELRVADNTDGHGFADVACMNGVPEPATLSLFGLGVIGLFAAGRKR
jgi:PEP-CTERM motif